MAFLQKEGLSVTVVDSLRGKLAHTQVTGFRLRAFQVAHS